MDEKEFKCPLCGKKCKEFPAKSRFDNKTDICPACGVREALNPFTEKELSDRVKAEKLDNRFLNEYMMAVMRRNIKIQYNV